METKEQQIKIRKSLNEAMRVNANAQTNFNNSWRKKFEKRGDTLSIRATNYK